MERNHILEELQSLRNLLNQGNKLANEKTELRFKIEGVGVSECRLLIAIVGQNEVHQIEISRRDQQGNWERSGFTSFRKLENHCSLFLNEWEGANQTKKRTNQNLSASDFDAICLLIQKHFDSGLID